MDGRVHYLTTPTMASREERKEGEIRGREKSLKEGKRRKNAHMTVLVRHFTAVFSSEPLLAHSKRQKLFCSCAMSLSETFSLPLAWFK